MKKKIGRIVKDAKYLHKSPPLKLDTGFCSLERFVVVNEYDDDTYSKEYNCDILIRKGLDAVGIIPYCYIENELYILIMTNFRAAALYREKVLGEKKTLEIDEHSVKIVEIPAGIFEESELKAKKLQDGVKRCAQRELLEETGYDIPIKNFEILGSFYYSSPGILTERIHITTCNITEYKQKEIETDGSVMEESIKPFFLSFKEAMEWCKEGVIRNAVTEIAIHRLYFLMLSEQQKTHNIILQRRLRTMYNEIRSLKKESSYYNKLIREFRAAITHELKHPFTEIMGYISLLKNKKLPDETKENAIDIISRSMKKLYDINNNLIKVALKDDDNSQDIIEFDVEEEINRIIEGYKILYSRNIEININIDKSCKLLIGYHDRFRLVLEGIISNAFKFIKNGAITINIRLLDPIEKKAIDFSPDLFNYHVMNSIVPNEVEIIIKDTGAGIKPKQLKKVFIPFYQGDSRFSREYGGMGIGLSVVKDLLDTMQGSINIDSSVGVGTIVKMRIPFGIVKQKTN